ncbi:MAG: single-stranded DNA-binding protein, partial [Clostridia bacterium]
MANINKILLMGRLTADPELKHTATNIAVSSFTIAVNRSYAKPGEQAVADFIDIVCWRQTAEFVSKYFTKGKPIFISGSLQTRMWEDKDGKKRKSVEVVADEVSFAEERSANGANNSQQNSYGNAPAVAAAPTFGNATTDNDFQELSDDDEL